MRLSIRRERALVRNTNPQLGLVTIGEYTSNRPASMTLHGAYDPLMQLKQITTIDPGGNLLLDYCYGYNKMNNHIHKEHRKRGIWL